MRLSLAASLALVACVPPEIKVPDSDTSGQTDDTAEAPLCPDTFDPLLETASGCVWGNRDGDVESFLGIPYAEPPTGALRFMPPVPITPWDDVFSAGYASEPCLQTGDSKDGALADGEGDEDCLTLNIWRPSDAEGLPIFFYVHGGLFLNGSGAVPDLAGSATLPETAVVVTHNYRLGPFGYLAHPALSAASEVGASGNQGVLDSLAALTWVHDNAEALGGDPDQIILVGQEAGGLQACALLMSPLSEGLIAAAVLESAACGWLSRPLAEPDESAGDGGLEPGESVGEELAEEIGCDGDDEDVIACLQDARAEEVRTALEARPAPLMDGEAPWEPVVDGYVLPDSVPNLVRAGEVPDVPVFAGVNADEGTLYAEEIDAEDIDGSFVSIQVNRLLEAFGATDVDALPEDTFSADTWGSGPAAFEAFYGYAYTICPTRTFLTALREARPAVYAYTFTHTPSFAADGLGAYTGAEVPFLFGTRSDEYTEHEAALSRWMQASWFWTVQAEPWVLDLGPWPDMEDRVWVDLGDAETPMALLDPYAEICEAMDATGWHQW